MKLASLLARAAVVSACATVTGLALGSAVLGLFSALACGLLLLIAATDYRGPRYAHPLVSAPLRRRESMPLAA